MNNNNSEKSNQETSAMLLGEKLLKELKEMGYDSSQVGKVFVRPSNAPLKETQNSNEQQLKHTEGKNREELQQESVFSSSPSRELRKLRIDILKERSELKELISKDRENSQKKQNE